MKWMGWVIALFCIVGFVAAKQHNVRKFQAAEADNQAELDDLRRQADSQVVTAQEGLDERLANLAKIRETTDQLQTQRDELKTREADLEGTIARLVADADRLRGTENQTADTRSENREEIQELQERINQADRNVALWKKMMAMVSEPAGVQ